MPPAWSSSPVRVIRRSSPAPRRWTAPNNSCTSDGADLVIEAVGEDLEVKRQLFAALGEVCRPDTILASNTSSFVPSRLADAAPYPERFVNLHFFNPALVMTCVEVVRVPEASAAGRRWDIPWARSS